MKWLPMPGTKPACAKERSQWEIKLNRNTHFDANASYGVPSNSVYYFDLQCLQLVDRERRFRLMSALGTQFTVKNMATNY